MTRPLPAPLSPASRNIAAPLKPRPIPADKLSIMRNTTTLRTLAYAAATLVPVALVVFALRALATLKETL